jgi:uncharacterized integral membrane protein
MTNLTSKLAVTTALIVLVLIFAVQNAAVVDVKLLFWEVAIPRWLLILLMLFIGVVIGWFLRSVIRILTK